jgi:hypothetical protein
MDGLCYAYRVKSESQQEEHDMGPDNQGMALECSLPLLYCIMQFAFQACSHFAGHSCYHPSPYIGQ